MVLCMWNLRGPHMIAPDLDKDYNGHDNFFTLKIHHGGFFSKFPGRKYVEGRLAFYDFVDTDLFLVHDLNDMIREIRVINVYVEHGSTRLHTYFMSPSKVVIEQLDDDPSPQLNRIRPKKKGIGSYSKKLDMNVPLKESSNQAQREDGVYDFSMSLVPFEPNKQDMINEFKDDSYFPIPEETDTMQEITIDINCQNHREMLDDFEPFSSDGYQNIGEFEREVEAGEEQDEEDEQGHAEDSKDDLEEHT
ncbi:unnamed protein product [Lactuca saligna]|uniref:PB1-like domain-containing protein n=1 Tax=Lactuca saligna TaxID=75948 RepID=A0AA35ZPC4_LACSI|nr:unnamed protein product [Lactuca saligna]